jgi:hypothetical protein
LGPCRSSSRASRDPDSLFEGPAGHGLAALLPDLRFEGLTVLILGRESQLARCEGRDGHKNLADIQEHVKLYDRSSFLLMSIAT